MKHSLRADNLQISYQQYAQLIAIIMTRSSLKLLYLILLVFNVFKD